MAAILIGEASKELALKCYSAARRCGHNAKICPSAKNALFDGIQRFNPDFVLCSAFMTDGNAAELIKKTKAIGREPFFIVTSTYRNFHVEKEITSFFNAYFMIEPFEPSAVVNAIGRMSDSKG